MKYALKMTNVSKQFVTKNLLTPTKKTDAVRNVNLEILQGNTLAIIGESGSGKTTIANLITKVHDITDGNISVYGQDISNINSNKDLLNYRKSVQVVSQNPFSALNPTHTVCHHLIRPVKLHNKQLTKQQQYDRVNQLLELVELNPDEVLYKFPHELSGGQRQRINLARALAVGAKFIIADEPTSMLDVSIRMSILNLMARLKKEMGISFLYITHDIATAKYVSETIAIMYMGQVVEWGETDQVINNPSHPYTKLLLSSVINRSSKFNTDLKDDNDFLAYTNKVRKVCMKTCNDIVDLGNGHFKLNHPDV